MSEVIETEAVIPRHIIPEYSLPGGRSELLKLQMSPESKEQDVQVMAGANWYSKIKERLGFI